MKPTSWLKLLGFGTITLVAIVALSQPGYAHKRPKVTDTKDSSRSAGVPGAPSASAAPGSITPGTVGTYGSADAPGMICVPGGTATCAPSPVAQSIAKDYFFCGQSASGSPITYIKTPTGNIPLIRWASHYFNHSGYNPTVQCQEVSQRFNRF